MYSNRKALKKPHKETKYVQGKRLIVHLQKNTGHTTQPRVNEHVWQTSALYKSILDYLTSVFLIVPNPTQFKVFIYIYYQKPQKVVNNKYRINKNSTLTTDCHSKFPTWPRIIIIKIEKIRLVVILEMQSHT